MEMVHYMKRVFRFCKAIYCWCIGGCKISYSAQDRLAICKDCEWYETNNNSPKCKYCGCLLELKTKMETEKCPIDKW